MSKNSTLGRPSPLSEDTVLDATRACILAVGIRRTTLADVARRLGVSRPTIYRRWPDIGSLVAAVVTRELTTLAKAHAPLDDGRRSILRYLVSTARELRDAPLLRKVVEVDPEWLLPYVFERRGASQDAGLAAIELAIMAGQRAGDIRTGDPALLARTVMLVLQSFVLSARTMAGPGDGDPVTGAATGPVDGPFTASVRASLGGPVPGGSIDIEALDAELSVLLDRYLAPKAPEAHEAPDAP